VRLFEEDLRLRLRDRAQLALAGSHALVAAEQRPQAVLDSRSPLGPLEVEYLQQPDAGSRGALPLVAVLVADALLRMPKTPVVLDPDFRRGHPHIDMQAAQHRAVVVLDLHPEALNEAREIALGVGRGLAAGWAPVAEEVDVGGLREGSVFRAEQLDGVVGVGRLPQERVFPAVDASGPLGEGGAVLSRLLLLEGLAPHAPTLGAPAPLQMHEGRLAEHAVLGADDLDVGVRVDVDHARVVVQVAVRPAEVGDRVFLDPRRALALEAALRATLPQLGVVRGQLLEELGVVVTPQRHLDLHASPRSARLGPAIIDVAVLLVQRVAEVGHLPNEVIKGYFVGLICSCHPHSVAKHPSLRQA